MISAIKKCLPSKLKLHLKERLLHSMGVSWNKFGVPECLMKHLQGRSGITLIDIGASSGQFTDCMDEAFDVAHAMLIEPQPERWKALKSKYAESQYKIICSALADKEGSVEMEILQWDQSSSILPVKRDRPEVSDVIDLNVREVITSRSAKLDVICSENEFVHEIDLIKLDVQGAEHLVLSGAAEALQRTRLLWTEVSFQPLYDGSSTIEDIIKQCRSHGFVLNSLSEGFRGGNSELLQADALFVKV